MSVNRIIKKLLFFPMFYISLSVYSADIIDKKNNETLKRDIKNYIDHHLKDSHDFSLFSFTNKNHEHIYVGIPLPVLLWDDGLQIFSSSKLKHGEEAANVNGNYYKLFDGKIYKTNSNGDINLNESNHPINTQPADFSLTKGVVSILFICFFMFFLFNSLARSYKKNGLIAVGIGRFFEPIIIYVRDEIAIPNIGIKYYKKYMHYLLTIFFFIWFLNLLGLMPFGINVTGNIAITFSLALLTFIITNVTGKKDYWKHIFWMPGVPWPMKIVLAPIELLGVFIKPFSLMIRLYANISAGHIVLMSLIALMFIFKNWIGSTLSFILAFSISIIEILVALLQAYIFTVLSALYFGFASEEHDHTDH